MMKNYFACLHEYKLNEKQTSITVLLTLYTKNYIIVIFSVTIHTQHITSRQLLHTGIRMYLFLYYTSRASF